jgi:hypothetical protein
MLHVVDKIIHFSQQRLLFTARLKQDWLVDSRFIITGRINTGRIYPHVISRVFRVIEDCAERHNVGAFVEENVTRIAVKTRHVRSCALS